MIDGFTSRSLSGFSVNIERQAASLNCSKFPSSEMLLLCVAFVDTNTSIVIGYQIDIFVLLTLFCALQIAAKKDDHQLCSLKNKVSLDI